MRPRPFGLLNVFVMIVVAVFVTTPLLYDRHVHSLLATRGLPVQAEVQSKRLDHGSYLVDVAYRGGDGVLVTWTDRVPEREYDAALVGFTVPAHVLSDPRVHEIDGAIRSSVPVVLAVAGDGGLLLVVLVLLLARRRLRMPQLVAIQDVEPIAYSGASLLRTGPTEYVVSGEVVEAASDAVGIDTGGGVVRVLLGGHHNPVGEHQRAQVVSRAVRTGRMRA